MTFFDTNVLVYSTVKLDKVKQEVSDRLIEAAIKENALTISTLVLSEFIYVLSKLRIDNHLVDLPSFNPNYPCWGTAVLRSW